MIIKLKNESKMGQGHQNNISNKIQFPKEVDPKEPTREKLTPKENEIVIQ